MKEKEVTLLSIGQKVQDKKKGFGRVVEIVPNVGCTIQWDNEKVETYSLEDIKTFLKFGWMKLED